jgi:ABC-type multidrug transport system ATPase subunit
MPLIDVVELSKEFRQQFRQPDHRPELGGSLVDLVRPRYVTRLAVGRVSFAIEPGECVAYVGANGSGKSTTIARRSNRENAERADREPAADRLDRQVSAEIFRRQQATPAAVPFASNSTLHDHARRNSEAPV